jgi:hypothetical protein
MIECLSLPAFIISLAIGLFFIYIWGPEIKTVYVYPSPDNVDKMLFQDKANQCFQLEQQEVSCPEDESQIFNVATNASSFS